MDPVRHRRRRAARIALPVACCALAIAATGPVALADSGQARDMAGGGVSLSHPAGVADAIAATAGTSRSRGLSRATGAPRSTGTPRSAAALDVRAAASAMLEKCVTSAEPAERYATFAGHMIAVSGSTGMAMRIGLEDRVAGERFHLLESASAPGLGAWRGSETGVKSFKDLKQVTNLGVPVDYRGVVHFRWTNSNGIVIKRETLRTPVCHEVAPEGNVGGQAPTARMPSR
jgi:hypothetical protein